MSYVVYVNQPMTTATVHGAAYWVYEKRIADPTDNGLWRDLLLTLDDAMACARHTAKIRVRECSCCLG